MFALGEEQGNLRREVAVSLAHRADRPEQFRAVLVLRQIPVDPGVEDAADIFLLHEAGEHQDLVTAERLGHVDAAHVAEAEIEDDDVGPMHRSEGDGLLAAPGFGDDAEVGFIADETGKAAPHDEMVVDQHDG